MSRLSCPVSRDLVHVTLELDQSTRLSHLIWSTPELGSLQAVALSHLIWSKPRLSHSIWSSSATLSPSPLSARVSLKLAHQLAAEVERLQVDKVDSQWLRTRAASWAPE